MHRRDVVPASIRSLLVVVFSLATSGCGGDAASGDGEGSVRQLAIDTVPDLDLGLVAGDTSELFNQVVGATRLADGTVIVGDRGSAQLKYFSADGRFVRGAGRRGKGPGEFGYMATLLRCGDSIVVKDISNAGSLVFGTDGGYRRMLRFTPPEAGRAPYRTACNADRTFLHYAFENLRADAKIGVYRANVPFWLTDADGAVSHVLGAFPGSERLGHQGGSRPLPLGRQTAIALGADRAFIGAADGYRIVVMNLSGEVLDTILRSDADVRTAPEDIELFKRAQLATTNPELREQTERSFATIPFPELLPPYSAIVLDRRGNLWVQDFPRGSAALTRWSIFSPAGTLVAEARLPTQLEVYEIGDDYILGKTLEPPDDVEHVRVYRISRRPGT